MVIKTSILISVLIFFKASTMFSQNADKQTSKKSRTNYGVSLQVYPAGVIPTVNAELYQNEKYSWLFRVGANLTNRRDFSDFHDEEKGGGFGGSAGYRRHIPLANKDELIVGLNTDLWNLWINYADNVGEPIETSGRTYILVLQPWLEGGYFFNLKNTSKLGITVGFGREFNVITSGEEVEQDLIGSISLQYMFGR